MSAIDFANYTDVPRGDQLDCLREGGVTRVIIGASFGNVAQQQAHAYAAAGFEVEGYAWLSSQSWYRSEIDRATAQLTVVAVGRWWLDCEENMGVLTVEAVRARVRECLDIMRRAAPRARLGIYTRRGWWVQWTGDWDIVGELPDVELFDALYVHGDGEPCAGIEVERERRPAFVPYGGWTARAMHQWHPSARLCPPDESGLNVDLVEIEEVDMDAPTIGEFRGLYGYVMALRDELGAAVLDMARHLYVEDEPRLRALQERIDALGTSAPTAPADDAQKGAGDGN